MMRRNCFKTLIAAACVCICCVCFGFAANGWMAKAEDEANTKYTLLFDKENSTHDMGSSAAGWWSSTGSGYSVTDGQMKLTRDDTNVSYFVGNADFTAVEAGKTYIVKISIKCDNMFVNFAVNDPWNLFSSSWINNTKFQDYEYSYTATVTGKIAFIFQLNAGSGDFYVRNFKIAEVQSKEISEGATIGTLPEIPQKAGYAAYWAINGEKISEETVYNYGADKVAKPLYIKIIEGASISLNGKIAINFYVNVVGDDESVTMKADGAETDVTNAFTLSGEKRVYTYSVAAKDYEKEVTLSVGKSASETTSVKKYIAYMQENIGAYSDYDQEKLNVLLTTLENYCMSAKQYFSGATVTNMADFAANLSEFEKKVSGILPEGVTIYGATLLLESETVIRVYFSGKNTTDAMCKIGGETVDAKQKGDVYYIEKKVSAKDLGTAYDFEIGTYKLTYSAYSYLYSVLNENPGNDNLTNLCKSIYNYGVAAAAFLAID